MLATQEMALLVAQGDLVGVAVVLQLRVLVVEEETELSISITEDCKTFTTLGKATNNKISTFILDKYIFTGATLVLHKK